MPPPPPGSALPLGSTCSGFPGPTQPLAASPRIGEELTPAARGSAGGNPREGRASGRGAPPLQLTHPDSPRPGQRGACLSHPSPGQGRSGRQGGGAARLGARPTGSREGRQPRRLQALAPLGWLRRLGGPGARRPGQRTAGLIEKPESVPGAPGSDRRAATDGPDDGPGPEGGAPGQAGSGGGGSPRWGRGGGGLAAGKGATAAGLTSRRGSRASVCRNLDTLKRFMAAGTAAGAASRTRASTLRCTASSRDSRLLPPHPRPAARGHAPTRLRPIAARSGPPSHSPSPSPSARTPRAPPPGGQSLLGIPWRPRPDAGGLAARVRRSRAARCPPPVPPSVRD